MPDGNLRRPPQPWESKLAKVTGNIGAGVSAGNATSIVPDPAPPGVGGGVEPAPVLPPPGDFIAPSAPTLITAVQGINVVWNGLNSAGDLWPSDTSYVEVHMDTTGPTFTVGTATLKGRLARPGGLSVVGLDRGTTYYFRLRGADPAGNVTAAGSAASGQPGQISAPDIAANAITANSIVAGTITGWSINSAYLSGGTVSGSYITGGTMAAGYLSGGTISGGYITGGTIDGSSLRTASSGARVEMGAAFSALSSVQLFTSSGAAGAILTDLNGGVTLASSGSTKTTVGNSGGGTDLYGATVCKSTLAVDGAADCNSTLNVDGATTLKSTCTVDGTFDANAGVTLSASGSNPAVRVATTGEVYSYGIDDNTTANAANVRIGTNAQLLKSTSTVRVKHELTPLADGLAGVPPEKIAAFTASVDPYDVLTLTPTEFRSLAPADADARNLGFIAEDVAIKFPWAANWDQDGIPSAVEDRPILAALLAVVQQQQQTIKDLIARIEALEG